MALPILETATYELTLPSADIVVKYRPFLVKEEKVLLQALESGDDNEIKNAIKDIVSTCTFNQLNASLLPTFDLEYIFLQIRSKSVGEIAKLKVDYIIDLHNVLRTKVLISFDLFLISWICFGLNK